MIIIKTANGDHFINDKEVDSVTHDREKHTAYVHRPQIGFAPINPPIEHVESVVYINDQTGQEWKDESSELEQLKAKYDEHVKWSDEVRAKYMELMLERDELKEHLAQLEPKADPDKWWSDDVDKAPVNVIIGHVEKNRRSFGYGVRLAKIFDANDIKTVGDLLRVGRHNFRTYNSVGNGSVTRIDDALEELYNIMSW